MGGCVNGRQPQNLERVGWRGLNHEPRSQGQPPVAQSPAFCGLSTTVASSLLHPNLAMLVAMVGIATLSRSPYRLCL